MSKLQLLSVKPDHLVQVANRIPESTTPSESNVNRYEANARGQALADALASHPLQQLMRYETTICRDGDRLMKLYSQLKADDPVVIDLAEGDTSADRYHVMGRGQLVSPSIL